VSLGRGYSWSEAGTLLARPRSSSQIVVFIEPWPRRAVLTIKGAFSPSIAVAGITENMQSQLFTINPES